MKNFYRLFLSLMLFFCCSTTAFAVPAFSALTQIDVQNFINQMVLKYHFNRMTLITLFSKVELIPVVKTKIQRPYEKSEWYNYKNLFITPDRIQQGVDFWKEHQAELDDASKKYGVPPEVIVAIIGIETKYGTRMGSFRVIDALSTLAFQYPRRAPFFQEELVQYLLMCRQYNLDPLSLYGSYAGAFGIPQFMPSSVMTYAVHTSPTGHLDLMNSASDAIASIANFLHAHGWAAKKHMVTNVKTTQLSKLEKIQDSSLSTNFNPSELGQFGLIPLRHLHKDTRIGILKLLDQKRRYEYLLGMHNLYVITTYNTSVLYAMAVYDLSRALKKEKTK